MQKLHWATEQTLIFGNYRYHLVLLSVYDIQYAEQTTCYMQCLVPRSDAPSLQTIAAQNALLPADHIYEQIELKPNNAEVEVSANAAYGMGRR